MTFAGKRLLVLGGSHSDIPMIRAGRALGFHVITSGNQPGDRGHAESDAYAPCDYSDPLASLDLATSLGIDAICASANDFSALSCAYIASKLGLPGYDTVEVSQLLHHKDKWRDYARLNEIAGPVGIGCANMGEVEEALRHLGFPILIKPIDLTGGKGIGYGEDLRTALEVAERAFAASPAHRVVVEEFVTGSRHGFSAILRDRKVAFHFSDDEHYHLSPYLVSAASAPSSCPPASIRAIVASVEKIAFDLNLVDGIVHLQFIMSSNGSPMIIEVCRRIPGDLYVELVRHATGTPYADWILRPFAGLGLEGLNQAPATRSITRHCLMSDEAGKFAGFRFGLDEGRKIIDRMVWAEIGDEILNPATEKLGIVFVEEFANSGLGVRPPLQSALGIEIT